MPMSSLLGEEKMKKCLLIAMMVVPMMGFCLNMNVMKTRTINGQGGKGVSGTDYGSRVAHSGFKDCWSRHFYEIRLSGATKKDIESTYKIRIMPILKFCKGGTSFPWFKGEVEKTGITVDPKKGYSCVYVSPLTEWTKDTWVWEDGSLLGGDMSKGIINSSIVVELIRESDDVVVKKWTNAPLPAFINTKTIDQGRTKMDEAAMTWLEEKVYPVLDEGGRYLKEESRIETMTWKAFDNIGKRRIAKR